RDGAIDEMLRTTLRADAARAAVSDECIDAETIAAWSDGALPAAGAAWIETQLSQCPDGPAVRRTDPFGPADDRPLAIALPAVAVALGGSAREGAIVGGAER